MLDVTLLGTGGMMPLPGRALTSLIVRHNGKSILIDCGEGTQVAIREKGLGMKPIGTILFTHLHADHIAGLPGLLLSMGQQERREKVRLIGPKGLSRVVEGLLTIAQDILFDIEITELSGSSREFLCDGLSVTAFSVFHRVPCYGYSIKLDRAGKFDPQKATEAGIPIKYWSRLQKGETVCEDGRTYEPELVLGPARKGLKLTYCTDTRPTDSIVLSAEDSDLLILEGMYGEDDKLKKAIEYKHMTCREAAEIALKANAKRLWLTHYSPSMTRPSEYIESIREIFPNTEMSENGETTVLNFEDD